MSANTVNIRRDCEQHSLERSQPECKRINHGLTQRPVGGGIVGPELWPTEGYTAKSKIY